MYILDISANTWVILSHQDIYDGETITVEFEGLPDHNYIKQSYEISGLTNTSLNEDYISFTIPKVSLFPLNKDWEYITQTEGTIKIMVMNGLNIQNIIKTKYKFK